MDEIVKTFKRMLVDTFDDHCGSGLYTLKHHLLYHIMEDLWNFGTLSVLNCSSYEQLNEYVKHSYRMTSQKRQKQIMETDNNLQRGSRGLFKMKKQNR